MLATALHLGVFNGADETLVCIGHLQLIVSGQLLRQQAVKVQRRAVSGGQWFVHVSLCTNCFKLLCKAMLEARLK